MKLNLKALSLIAVVALLASVIAAPVFAQDGGDEAELVQRIIDAAEAVESYESYNRTDLSGQTINISLVIPALAEITQTSESSTLIDSTIISGDNPNGSALVLITVDSSEDDGSTTTTSSVVVEGEVRLVDNALYATASVLSAEGDASVSLPEGWVLLTDDVAGASTLSAFDSEFAIDGSNFSFELFDDFVVGESDDEEDGGLDAVLEFLDIAESVTLSTDTLDDGTTVDVITIVIDGRTAFSDPALGGDLGDDPFTTALLDAVFSEDGSDFELNFAIDEDGRLVGYFFTFNVSFVTDDLSTVVDVTELGLPEGFQVSLTFEVGVEQTTLYSSINEAFTPAEAPTVAE